MASKRWIRLDATWEDSEWLFALDGVARGCWPRLLCRVKRDGVRGRCKRPAPVVLADQWRVPVEAILALEAAACAGDDPALTIEDGDWVVTKWADFQETDPTAAARMRRHRAERSRLSPLRVTSVTDRDTGRNLSCATETETETKENISPKREKKRGAQLSDEWRPNALHRELAKAKGVDIALEYDRFRDHAVSVGRICKDWDAAFRNWLRKAAEFTRSGRPPAGSEASKIFNESPGRGRQGTAQLHRVVNDSGTHYWDDSEKRWMAI